MEQIGRYQILEEVGRGAMGVVYRAQDPAIGRVIAIKTIRLNDLSDTEERQRLRDRLFREAQSAGILSHPNIVTIYDIAEEKGQACIFMEFVNGPSLEKLLCSHQPPDKQTFLQIFRQTAIALDYAHRKGIVHRDIKPANVMIHEDGQAKITDFGVAKIISQQMTQSGGMMGTPNYMSPEQVHGLAVDGRADQFSLAVIAYELLTGEKPFSGDTLATLLYKIVREDELPPQRLNPSLGFAIEAVLHRGLAKNPDERYPTCTEFIESLMAACASTSGWIPLPRGASPNLPTMAESSTAPPMHQPVQAPIPPPRPVRRESDTTSGGGAPNPLFKNLAKVLVVAGILAIVLWAAQKFVLSPSNNKQAEQAAATQPSPAPGPPVATPPTPPPAENKPSPSGGLVNPSPKPELPADSQPASPAPASSGTKAERQVQLLTDPPGAIVTVDGAGASCKTPCMVSLGPGRHTLDAQFEGFRPYPKVFNVPEETDLFLKLTKAVGTLNIGSNPPGATIQIDGETRPQKTPATFVLSPATYKVRVTREGVPLDFEVQIRDGEFQTRTVNFQ